MKTRCHFFAGLLAAVLMCGGTRAETGSGRTVKIVICGDSTVANYDTSKTGLRGWGQVIGDGFKPGVQIVNLARGGRSTKTFIKEKLLVAAVKENANFELIQFGHNDSHAKDKPEATDAKTDFKEYLRTYVDSFRKAGTEPVLITPMHRRLFKDGKPTEELLPYADAIKEIATEMKVPLIDLHAMSGELLAKLGDAGSEDLFFTNDRTHFAEKGARMMADLILQGIGSQVPALRDCLRTAGKP